MKTSRAPVEAANPSAVAAIALGLFAVTLAVYWQVRTFDFVVYDDELYVVDNYVVRAGLTREGLWWALTNMDVNWHPLTWLSHMLDCELFGLDAGAHHLVNAAVHALNTMLLFVVLQRMTAVSWPSAFVAALFGLHPLHVESVAWVAERKDVLSTLFWILTMWTYLRYTQRPNATRYLAVVSTLVLGLLAKPMVVTLPFVFLLLDYWPLRRFETAEPRRLLLEKVPLFILVAIAGVITVVAQRQMGALAGMADMPLEYRIGNALVAYVAYLAKAVWPTNLSVFYPHPAASLSLWLVLVAAACLIGISLLVLRSARRFPYLAVGWAWYVGTLVPVIGLVQVGRVAMADRYTYIPLIGGFIMLAWGISELAARRRWPRPWLATVACLTLVALAALTHRQVARWRNSVILFEQALAVTDKNYLAHTNLGYALEKIGRLDDAATQYEAALRVWPGHAVAHRNLGAVLDRQGKTAPALHHLSTALSIAPDDPKAHDSMGIVLTRLGRLDEAEAQFSTGLRLDPNDASAHSNLGDVLIRQGRFDEAMKHLNAALRLQPDYAGAHNNAGVALAKQGKLADAVEHFSAALRLDPNHASAKRNLSMALQQQGRAR